MNFNQSERNVNMINEFKGKYYFLSNFYYAPVMYEGLLYQNNEAAFQSAKVKDLERRKQFCQINPSTAKRKGRNVLLRNDWEDIKDEVMEDCIRDKFTRNPDLRRRLIETGDEELVEGNYWHDNYYGNCSCDKCKNIVGKNTLGKTLMKIRKEIKDTCQNHISEI